MPPAENPPLTPEARARGNPRGPAVRIAGHAWHLPAAVVPFGAAWDRLYDQNVLRGRYDPDDLRLAAIDLLWAGYRLSADEAVTLARAADPADLVAPVEAALFGPEKGVRTWTDWARSALYANGLDPRKVPPAALHDVLDQLVSTGRAADPHSFLSSLAAKAKRRRLLDPHR